MFVIVTSITSNLKNASLEHQTPPLKVILP